MPQHVVNAPGDPLLGQLLAGRYRVESVLAEGGTGRVYRAVQEALGRRVAVKVTRPATADGALAKTIAERFVREAALAGSLNHPNVVTIHDFGHLEDGRAFLVMELLEGMNLAQVLRRGPLAPEAALELFEPLLRGLRAAHRAGLVHRDVKPANVMVVEGEDGRATVKVLDFGLVKDIRQIDVGGGGELAADAAPDITQVGTFLGTPQYVAPEQIRGEEPDARADIYGVGVMLYRALTGMLPFDGAESAAILHAHLHVPVPPMAERSPNIPVPPELERVVRRCMEKLPSGRYPDVDALLDALARAKAGFAGATEPARGETPAVDEGVTLLEGFPGDAATEVTGAVPTAEVSSLDRAPPSEATPEAQVNPPRTGIARWVAIATVAALLLVASGLVLGAKLGDWLRSPPDAPPIATAASTPALPPPTPPPPAPVASPPSPSPAADATIPPEPPAPPTDAAGPAGAAATPAHPAAKEPKRAPTKAPVADPPEPEKAEPPKPPAGVPTAVVADNVRFSAEEAAAAARFLDTATHDQLLAAGIAPKQVNIILDHRPFGDVATFAETPFIGEKTVQAIKAASQAR